MICPNCGRKLPDGAVCPCGGTQRLLSSNPALHALKSVGSSPAFLAAAILYLISSLLSIIDFFYSRSMNYGVPSYYYNYNAYIALKNLEGLIGSVPMILMTIALWIHYFTCKQTRSGNISTAGLTLWRVVQIILACLSGGMILTLLLSLIIYLVSRNQLNDYISFYYSQYYEFFGRYYFIGEIIIGVVVSTILACALFLCYEIVYAKMLGRIRRTALSGVADKRISRFVIGMLYVCAGSDLIMSLSRLRANWIGALFTCCSAAGMILLAILFSRYKKNMALVMYLPMQPVHAAPPQVSQNYQVPQNYPVQPPQPPVTVLQPESFIQKPETPIPQPEAAPVETPSDKNPQNPGEN